MATRSTEKPATARKRKTARSPHGPNRGALESSLEALAIGPEHAALVEAARSLADVVDMRTDKERDGWNVLFDDKAWREYRLTLAALMEATSDGGSDEFARAVDELRAKMGNPQDA